MATPRKSPSTATLPGRRHHGPAAIAATPGLLVSSPDAAAKHVLADAAIHDAANRTPDDSESKVAANITSVRGDATMEEAQIGEGESEEEDESLEDTGKRPLLSVGAARGRFRGFSSRGNA